MVATDQALIAATSAPGTPSKMYTATVYALKTGTELIAHNTTVSVTTLVIHAVVQSQLTVSPARKTRLSNQMVLVSAMTTGVERTVQYSKVHVTQHVMDAQAHLLINATSVLRTPASTLTISVSVMLTGRVLTVKNTQVTVTQNAVSLRDAMVNAAKTVYSVTTIQLVTST